MYKFQNAKLPLKERARDLLSRLTLDEKINMLSTRQCAVERLGVSEWFIGSEVARGYVSRDPDEPTTVFPQPIGLSGTFDREIMLALGEIAGEEARIIHSRHPNGHLMLWGPTVDMCRDPLWGRNEEGYGEDPFLAGEMSSAYTEGLSHRKDEYYRVIPTLKHFCANNNERERTSSSSNIDPRTKHEYYYAAFEPAIRRGGANSVMTAYNELSEMPAIENPDLKNILKDEWGLGFVVTDGGDLGNNVLARRMGASHAESLANALKSGVDALTDRGELVSAAAYEALEKGLIEEKDIDNAVYNTLLGRFRLGEFDEISPYPVDEKRIDCDEFKLTNRLAAKKQIVLLKNDGLLPLKKDMKIAVVGVNGNANLMDWYTGYSSYNVTILEGLKKKFTNVSFDNGCDITAIKSKLTGKYLGVNEKGEVKAIYEKDDLKAAFEKQEYGHNEITFKSLFNGKYFTENSFKADSEGTYRWFSQEIIKPQSVGEFTLYETYFGQALGIDENGLACGERLFGISDDKLFSEETISSAEERVKALAANADAVIVCVGNDPMVVAREMFDRKTLDLPEHQKRLVKAAFEVNKKTIMAVVSSYPFAICEEKDYLPAIVYTTHAGPELGNAFAEVIRGEYNPAGRLAQTWYKSEKELAPINDYNIIENDMTYLYYKGEPLFPFGYGLSYSRFKYGVLEAEQRDDKIYLSLNVENISDIDGEEVVQIYFKANSSRVKRPLKQLCAFSRKEIKAGKAERFEFEIPLEVLRFYDVSREKFCVEKGEYLFFAGGSCEDARTKTTVFINAEELPPRDLFLPTKAINYDRAKKSRMKYSRSEKFHYMQGGELVFEHCDLNGANKISVEAAGQSAGDTITLKINGEMISETEISPAVNIENFTEISVQIPEISSDNASVELLLSEFAALKQFKFCK